MEVILDALIWIGDSAKTVDDTHMSFIGRGLVEWQQKWHNGVHNDATKGLDI